MRSAAEIRRPFISLSPLPRSQIRASSKMAPASSKLPAPRKRTRKRKRRVASSSSSSSDSDSSSSSSTLDAGPPVSVKFKVQRKALTEEEDLESSSSSENTSEDSDSDVELREAKEDDAEPSATSREQPKSTRTFERTPSPPPQAVPIPPFLPNGEDTTKNAKDEEQLKERFRKFWMTTMVDAFADDLEEIRKVGTILSSRVGSEFNSLLGAQHELVKTSTTHRFVSFWS